MNVNDIIAYEQGDLSDEDTIKMFQAMINDGSVWGLQGHYGRTAQALIEAELCKHATVRHKDYYGNTLPSKSDVKIHKQIFTPC